MRRETGNRRREAWRVVMVVIVVIVVRRRERRNMNRKQGIRNEKQKKKGRQFQERNAKPTTDNQDNIDNREH